MTFQEITEIIAAGLGSIGFSMMFQLRGKKLILIGCGGALSWFIFLFGKNSGSSLNGLLWAVIVAALASALAGALGDLAASSVKRAAQIKDYSHLIPGHGGMLDRVDSALFAIPVCYMIYALFV